MTTKFYRILNKLLRRNNINDILSTHKYAAYFLRHFVQYFIDYGITGEKYRRLYRGIKDKTLVKQSYDDNGFSSTSLHKHIAEDFAKPDGMIIEFKTRHLPPHSRCIYINESIEEHLLEEEVLLPPGTFTAYI